MLFKRNILIFLVLIFFLININLVFSVQSNVSAGVKLTYKFVNSSSPYTTTLYDITKDNQKTPFPVDGNPDTKTVTYNSVIDRQNYPYDIYFKIFPPGNPANIMCNSTTSLENCTINYNSNYEEANKELSFIYCNQFGACGISYKNFIFSQFKKARWKRNGFVLDILINNLCTSEPSYVSPPTPINNQKIIDIKNITIKVFGEGNDLKSCKVVINNSINNISKTYIMNNNGSYCTYVYQINETNNIQRIDFQVYYNVSSSEHSMDRRTLYVYPSSENSIKVLPAYGLGSLIITLVVIIGGFLI